MAVAEVELADVEEAPAEDELELDAAETAAEDMLADGEKKAVAVTEVVLAYEIQVRACIRNTGACASVGVLSVILSYVDFCRN